MELEKILAQVPDYKAFLTVDEMDAHTLALPERYPGVCSVFKAGESQKGRPIYVLKIGRGSRNAFIMGCPHPQDRGGARGPDAGLPPSQRAHRRHDAGVPHRPALPG